MNSFNSQCALLTVFLASALPLAGRAANYALTQGSYNYDADFQAACVAEFGPGAQVADWEEIKANFGGSVEAIRDFCDRAGLTAQGQSAWVLRGGQAFFSCSCDRHYLLERHEGTVPGGWLVHDDIQADFLDLGSWFNSRPILVKLGPPTPALGYALTQRPYNYNDDLPAACVAEFGPGTQVADWEEIKNSFGGSVEAIRGFCDQAGLTAQGQSAWVLRGGQAFFSCSCDRHYLLERHEGTVPGGWLVHDDIQADFLDLGSWFNSRPILVKLPETFIQVTGVTKEGADIRVTWRASGGSTNLLEATPGGASLSNSNSFSAISPLIILPGSGMAITNYVDVGGATNAVRFYRVRRLP